MFDKLRRARTDLATMNAVFPAAERIARDDGVDRAVLRDHTRSLLAR